MTELTKETFSAVRHSLGVTGEWLAEKLGVGARQVRKWEGGTAPIPKGVWSELRGLTRLHDEHLATGVPDDYPDGWRRAVLARKLTGTTWRCDVTPDEFPGMWTVAVWQMVPTPIRLAYTGAPMEDVLIDGDRIVGWEQGGDEAVMEVDRFPSSELAHAFAAAFLTDGGHDLEARRDRALDRIGLAQGE